MAAKSARIESETARMELQTEILRAFESAKHSRRTANWLTTAKGPNSDIRPALQTLIQRSQDLLDSDSWCKRAVDVVVSNWIGEGVEGTHPKASKAYDDGWQEWAGSTDCDFYGQSNFYGLQEIAARCIAGRGSVLVRKRISQALANEGRLPLQLQVLEPDWLDRTRDDGALIVGGKVYDKEGRWQGAWLWDQHPGESDWATLRLKSTYVPRSELLHCYEVRRPSQYTGVPWGATALIDARDLADYDSAALLKQKLAACFAGFVTDTDLEADRTGDVLTETIEPGLIQRLSPGQSIVFPDPPKVDNDKEFRAYYLRKVAVAYGISYEALTGDMSEVNFSSGRMGWLEMARNIARWRWNILVPQFLDPVAAWYQQLAKVSFRTTSRVPSGRMQWTPPLREMINPVEEIKWLAEAVRAGFMTLSEVQRSFGYVPSDLLDELASDLEAARKRGLALSVDGTMDVGRLQATAFADKATAGPQPAAPENADPEPANPPPGDPVTAG